MKIGLLDVLMYIYEHYVDEETMMLAEDDGIEGKLAAAGFEGHEVNSAFEWLESLTVQKQHEMGPVKAANTSMRIYSDRELAILDAESRGFLYYLEQLGVLSAEIREIVLDRLLALEEEEIDLERLKWVVLMVLFNQPGQEHAISAIEELVFANTGDYMQ